MHDELEEVHREAWKTTGRSFVEGVGGSYFQLPYHRPARLPDKPRSPNHLGISLAGLALGVGIGLGLTVLLELIEVRVWHERDLEGLVPGHLLVSVPRLSTQGEDRYRWVYRWLELGAAVVMIRRDYQWQPVRVL